MAKTRKFYGTGRRKSSVARVTLVPGKGNVTVNGKTEFKEKGKYTGNAVTLRKTN